MEFQIGPAYIWMAVCIGLLFVILLLSSLICCFCCSQRSARLQSRKNQNRSQRLGSSRLTVHRPQSLEDEEQSKLAILTRSFSTFSPKPLPASNGRKSDANLDFPELREVGAKGASTSAPSLILDGSFRPSRPRTESESTSGFSTGRRTLKLLARENQLEVVVVTTDDFEAVDELDVEDQTPFVSSKRTTMSEDAFADFVVPLPPSGHVLSSSNKSSRSSRK